MQTFGIFFKIFVASFILLLLAGCGSKKISIPYNGSTPNYGTMHNSAQVQRATMRPYQINGKWYYPTTVTLGESYDGVASWYGPKFHGKKTSNGETYNMYAHTAAHKTLPMNTIVRVTSKENGKSTIVRINDRGPFIAGRIIDLSKAAANDISMTGLARVRVEVIGFNGAISNSLPLNQETLAQSEYKVTTTQKTMQLSQFLVQIGAFRRKEGAQTYQKSYANIQGYQTIIKEYLFEGSPIYRVMLSGFKSEAEARDFIASQKIAGAFIAAE